MHLKTLLAQFVTGLDHQVFHLRTGTVGQATGTTGVIAPIDAVEAFTFGAVPITTVFDTKGITKIRA